MLMIDRIVELQKESGLSVRQFEMNIHVTNGSLGSWIKGKYKPGIDAIMGIADFCNVSTDYILGRSDERNVENTLHSPNAQVQLPNDSLQFATTYTDLDAHGQRAVRAVMEAETQRMNEEAGKPPVVMMKLRHYEYPAAAGDPLWGEDSYDYRLLPEDAVPEHADFSVKLSGDSMEPDYPDGSIVFVRRTVDIEAGDIVIAWIPGEGMVCKKAVVENERIMGLTSINPTGPSFVGERLSDMRVYGKIVNP